jgi:signal transduction histidine kinase
VSDSAEALAPFEDAPAAIAVQRGPELRWELANACFRGLLGGRPLVGLTLAEVLPDWSQLRRILEEIVRTGQPYAAKEHRFFVDARGTGELTDAWFDIRCQPLFAADGQVDGVFTFAVDVTAQVEVRLRLERVAADLRRAVEARDDFLGVASHELRTPLTALGLQVQTLQRSLQRSSPDESYPREQLVTRVDNIDRQLERLVELIDALLDVTRVNAGNMDLTLETVDLVALAREIIDRERAAATSAGSTLTLTALAPVSGQWDRSRLDQVLTNLLSNAIKYGAGKPITVVVATGPVGARLSVRDEGLGISAADQARIFERFERAVSRTHYAGLGLGLWISRRIAEALGGQLSVESEPGHGATFTLWLP